MKLQALTGKLTNQAMTSSTLHHLHFLLLLLLLSFIPTSFTIKCTASSGKALSSLDENPLSLSPSGEFAFGFRQVPQPFENEHLFLLAIWFCKIPDKTIVWSANGDNLAPADSTVSLTEKGVLVLQNPQGGQIWNASTNGTKSICGAMQDDGNFVLLDTYSNSTWESFKEPTDTILPGQILSMPSNLTSRQSAENYSDGGFRFHLQMDGNLVLYYVSMPTGSHYGAYWASNTVNTKSELIYDTAGYIYLKDGKTKILNLTTKTPKSAEDFYHMARIDSDGVFKQYSHPKSKDGKCNDMSWTVEERIPQDICLAITMTIGSGACGYNSYCVEANGGSDCFCPEKYSYVNQEDRRKGCKPDFSLPSCQNNGWEADHNSVEFKEYKNTDWPLSDYDLQIGIDVDKKTCMRLCLEDCFCAAAIHNGNNCWKKKYPLSNGRKSSTVNRTALIKVPVLNITELSQQSYITKKDQSGFILVGSLLLGSSVFINILLLSAISVAFYLYHKKVLNVRPISSVFATNVRSYTYKELEEATRGFKQVLGRGAFGTVYKGVLASDPKRFVAIKKLDKKLEQDGEKEFKTEVSVIGQTHHKNLVRLLGYCDEGEQRLLVYEYMSNGSLSSFLFSISRPDWNQRVQIAFGISRGLMYLHEECSTQIIHCDIKPQNILLDEYFTPRIADFGLAKLLLAEQTRARTAIRGTVGYFAPEWFKRASITVKVDVYSFGMMLLEIICCKSSVVVAMGNQEEALMDWVYECYKQRKLDKLVENDEEARNDMTRLERIVMVAIWCIQEDASLRPSMKKATQMLEGVIKVSVPPCPWNYSTS